MFFIYRIRGQIVDSRLTGIFFKMWKTCFSIFSDMFPIVAKIDKTTALAVGNRWWLCYQRINESPKMNDRVDCRILFCEKFFSPCLNFSFSTSCRSFLFVSSINLDLEIFPRLDLTIRYCNFTDGGCLKSRSFFQFMKVM